MIKLTDHESTTKSVLGKYDGTEGSETDTSASRQQTATYNSKVHTATCAKQTGVGQITHLKPVAAAAISPLQVDLCKGYQGEGQSGTTSLHFAA